MSQSIMRKFTNSIDYNKQGQFEQQNFKMIVHTPKQFEDVQNIADDLLDEASVLIHFSLVDIALKCRIFDYMNGLSYALEAQAEKISDDIFIYVPKSASLEKEGTSSDKIKNGFIF